MITYLNHRIGRLLGFRALIAGATGLVLSMFAISAPAQSTRQYQMSILATTDGSTAASSDIPIFNRVFSADPQPAGRSIAWLPPNADLDQYGIDWTRIVAVYVDEPYLAFVNHACNAQTILDRTNTLSAMAAALRVRAPSARFWVNFNSAEVGLIMPRCPINQPYIDVISLDWYHVNFQDGPDDLYQYIYTHRHSTSQQLALIGGTFTDAQQNGQQAADRFLTFLSYAATMNQSCNLPLGPTGRTGIYDGCPVWMVAGWTGGVTPPADAPNTYPIDHPNSTTVFGTWQYQSAIRRVDPTQVRRARDLVPLILLD